MWKQVSVRRGDSGIAARRLEQVNTQQQGSLVWDVLQGPGRQAETVICGLRCVQCSRCKETGTSGPTAAAVLTRLLEIALSCKLDGPSAECA